VDITKRIIGICVLAFASQAVLSDPWSDFTKMVGNVVSPKFDLDIQHPPAVPLKVTTVALAKPEGQCAEDLATRVEEDFVSAGVTVIDRQRFEDVLAEHKLQVSALVDQKTAAKVGALLGAQALVFLKVLDCHEGKGQQSLGTDKKGISSYNYVVQGTLSGSVRVVSLTTGQVLASQRFEGAGEASSFQGYPDPTVAMGKAETNAAFSVHKLLLPWKETKHIVFYSDSQCSLKTASNMLKSRDIDGALEQSEKNLSGCPADPKIKPAILAHAYYNLGILQFMKDDFDGALANLNKALELDSTKVYTDAIADCKRARELSAAVTNYQESLHAGAASSAPKTEAKPIKLADARKSTPPAGTPSVADRLSNLDDLLKKKLISQDEYNAKRAQILGGI